MMTDSTYTSFREVERGTESDHFKGEPELRQGFVEALKKELERHCSERVARFVLRPMLDRVVRERRRPDIRFSNVVIEVEAPKADLARGREQLRQYMEDLVSTVEGLIVHGVVTNGIDAEYYTFDGERLELRARGRLSEVMAHVLSTFCAEKITVVTPEDLVDILGV